MKVSSYLGEKDAVDFMRRVKKAYRDESSSIKKEGKVSVAQLYNQGQLLFDLYSTGRVLRLDEKIIKNSMGEETDAPQIVLYFLCLANKMPDVQVELCVSYNYTNEFRDVYNALLASDGHHNPLLLPALYLAIEKGNVSTF